MVATQLPKLGPVDLEGLGAFFKSNPDTSDITDVTHVTDVTEGWVKRCWSITSHVHQDEPFDPWASAAADGTSAAVMKSAKKKLLGSGRRFDLPRTFKILVKF